MGSMKRSTLALTMVASAVLVSGCATQSPPMAVKDAPQSVEVQKQMQQDTARALLAKPTLKRKIARE